MHAQERSGGGGRAPRDADGGWGRRLTRGAAVAATTSAGWQVGPTGQRHGRGGAGWAAADAGSCAREGGVGPAAARCWARKKWSRPKQKEKPSFYLKRV